MRDTFLVFLMVIGSGMIGTAVWLWVRMLREDGGCLAPVLALLLLGAGSSLLGAVGHQVGVTVPHLGW